MTTLQERPAVTLGAERSVTPQITTGLGRALAAVRIAFGLTFLWAFFDKLFALGFSTGRNPETGVVDYFGDAAWINGGNPTLGFLKFGTAGPFQGFFGSIAGHPLTNWGFMMGLLLIGLALTLGVAMRLGTLGGGLMYLLMWLAVLPPANHPVLDDHVLGALTMIVLVLGSAGAVWGLGRAWEKIPAVQRFPILK